LELSEKIFALRGERLGETPEMGEAMEEGDLLLGGMSLRSRGERVDRSRAILETTFRQRGAEGGCRRELLGEIRVAQRDALGSAARLYACIDPFGRASVTPR
jgi:hypothetical protein